MLRNTLIIGKSGFAKEKTRKKTNKRKSKKETFTNKLQLRMEKEEKFFEFS